MLVSVIHQGRFGNKVFQYLVARNLADRLGADGVAGFSIPELGLGSQPPSRYGRMLVCTGNRLAIEQVVRAAADRRADSVVVSGNVLQAGCLPTRENARQWLGLDRGRPQERVAPPDQIVLHVRSGDIVFGAHRDYPPIPPTFYSRVIAESGLQPIFVLEPGDNYYVAELRRRWPDAEFVSNVDPLVDFRFLLSAPHLCIAASTFGWLAGWLGRAQTVHMPVIGVTNPLQRPDINLIPAEDGRYRYWLFPRFRFHARPAEIRRLLSDELVPQRLASAADVPGSRRPARSDLRVIRDGDRWNAAREGLPREPVVRGAPDAGDAPALPARVAEWMRVLVPFAALPWLDPLHAGVGTLAFVALTSLLGLCGCGLPRLTVDRNRITQAQASAIHWLIVGISLATGIACALALLPWGSWGSPGPAAAAAIIVGVALAMCGAGAEPEAVLVRRGARRRIQSLDSVAAWASTAIAAALAAAGFFASSACTFACGRAAMRGALAASLGGWRPTPPIRGTGIKPLLREGVRNWIEETAATLLALLACLGVLASCGTAGLGKYGIAVGALAACRRLSMRSSACRGSRAPGDGLTPSNHSARMPSAAAMAYCFAIGAFVLTWAPSGLDPLLAPEWSGIGAALAAIIPWACICSAAPAQAVGRLPSERGRRIAIWTCWVATALAATAAARSSLDAALHATGAGLSCCTLIAGLPGDGRRPARAIVDSLRRLALPAAAAAFGGLSAAVATRLVPAASPLSGAVVSLAAVAAGAVLVRILARAIRPLRHP